MILHMHLAHYCDVQTLEFIVNYAFNIRFEESN
jgi:hypothetical protein